MVSGHSWELPARLPTILTAIKDIHCPRIKVIKIIKPSSSVPFEFIR